MKKVVGRRFWLNGVAGSTGLIVLRSGSAAPQGQQVSPQPVASFEAQQEKTNAWTVGLAAGQIEGAPLRLAAEMARVVDDGANLQLLPIVTRGPTDNLNALLYLRGVDLAIINSDALEEYKAELPDLRRHVVQLLDLFPSELHVFVRPEIGSLNDLVGKRVNFNTLGTTAAYSGPLLFSRLGIDVEKAFIPHQVAMQHMRQGNMSAVVFVTSKPVDAFMRGRWEAGYKFLPVPYDARFEDYYLPAFLGESDYPALISSGERVATLSVPTLLVAYNWPLNSNRYQRVARFAERLFERIDRLQGPGFDTKWKAVNLASATPGLARFPAAEEWLQRKRRKMQAQQ